MREGGRKEVDMRTILRIAAGRGSGIFRRECLGEEERREEKGVRSSRLMIEPTTGRGSKVLDGSGPSTEKKNEKEKEGGKTARSAYCPLSQILRSWVKQGGVQEPLLPVPWLQ